MNVTGGNQWVFQPPPSASGTSLNQYQYLFQYQSQNTNQTSQPLDILNADPFRSLPKGQKVSPIVGFRVWNLFVFLAKLQLSSLTSSSIVWPVRDVMTSTCHVYTPPFHHIAPEMKCECGLYAYKSWPVSWQSFLAAFPGRIMVRGAIVAWGKVIEHDEGFRAQYARILCLALEAEDYVNAYLDMLGVPLVAPEHVVDYAKEFGDLLE